MRQYAYDQLELAFKNIMINEHDLSDKYSIIVPTIDDWEFPLPQDVLKADMMKLNITEWSKEESYLDNSGIYVTTAFGENENHKFFPFTDIAAIFSSEGEEIFIKKHYSLPKPIPEPIPEPITTHTLKSIMHKDTEGTKHSMTKLNLNKPKDK